MGAMGISPQLFLADILKEIQFNQKGVEQIRDKAYLFLVIGFPALYTGVNHRLKLHPAVPPLCYEELRIVCY